MCRALRMGVQTRLRMRHSTVRSVAVQRESSVAPMTMHARVLQLMRAIAAESGRQRASRSLDLELAAASRALAAVAMSASRATCATAACEVQHSSSGAIHSMGPLVRS